MFNALFLGVNGYISGLTQEGVITELKSNFHKVNWSAEWESMLWSNEFLSPNLVSWRFSLCDKAIIKILMIKVDLIIEQKTGLGLERQQCISSWWKTIVFLKLKRFSFIKRMYVTLALWSVWMTWKKMRNSMHCTAADCTYSPDCWVITSHPFCWAETSWTGLSFLFLTSVAHYNVSHCKA